MLIDRADVFVHLVNDSERVLAGELRLQQGLAGCTFRYADDYLSRENAFAIDPFTLPLRPGAFAFPRAGDVLLPHAFADATPDHWGRAVIDRTSPLGRSSDFDYLLAASGHRIGALSFGSDNDAPAADLENLVELEEGIDRVRKRQPLSDRMRLLLRPGTTLGGIRPKASLMHEGALWIAKFNARDEDLDAVSLEYAGMKLAALCGLNVAEVRKVELDAKRRVLLIRRFDRAPATVGLCRLHYLSGRTFITGYAKRHGEEAIESYPLLAESRRSVERGPMIAEDLAELFSRMVFNIIIDNTDDHWKNHGFIRNADGWRLSPAFDIGTQLTNLGYQGMAVGAEREASTLTNALSECARFGLHHDKAIAVIRRLVSAAAVWKNVYAECGVDVALFDRIEPGWQARSQFDASMAHTARGTGRRSRR